MTFPKNQPESTDLPNGDATASAENMNLSTRALLLQAAQNGDRDALESLLSEESSSIYRFGMKMCRHEQDAEDILQETMLAASRSIVDFHGESSLSTWLYTIARSFCIKKRRQGKFAPNRLESLESHASEAEQIAHSGHNPQEAAQSRELQAALEQAMSGLDPEHREVILLRDVEGLKASEVATVLGVSVVAVKSRLHRARLRLRETLTPAFREATISTNANCPDILSIYSQNLEGELSAEVCTQMKAHLEGCSCCQARCESLQKTLALCSAYPKTTVPESVQFKVKTALRELALSSSSQQ